jgi:putative ABC transport system permease protein
MPLFLRLLRHRRAAWLSFVVIYSLGLSVFLVVNGLARNFRADIRAKSREMLEGEMRVYSRREFTEAEKRSIETALPAGTRRAEVWGFLSMLRAQAGGKSRLVQVKAVSPEYPLAGAFTFAGAAMDPGKVGGDAAGKGGSFTIASLRSGGILFPRELFLGLHVALGDTVKLGKADFMIQAEVKTRPGGPDFWELGPRVYIPLADMAATGLEQKGSRIFRYRYFNFPPGTDVAALRQALEKTLTDPEIEIVTYLDEGSDLGRSFQMVTSFLKMLSLSAFLLSAVGASFFFRHHLVGERKTVAVLATLGAPRRRIVLWFAAQNLTLSLLSAILGMGLAQVWAQGLPLVIKRLYDIEIPARLPLGTFAIGLCLSVVTSLLFGISGFLGLGKIPPASLIKPLDAPPLRLPVRAALFAAQGAYFFALAMADSRSWVLSALWVGSMGACFVLLAALGWALFASLWALRHRLGYALRVVLGSIRWGSEKSLLAFSALGFVAFISCLVPQLQKVILNEIKVPKGRILPQLFLFDIQEDQLEGLEALLRKLGQPLDQPSAMVRARLEKVNGKPFRKDEGVKATVEERNRQQFRNRGFNLGYRDTLSEAEKVVAGSWWHGPAQAGSISEVSVEKEFAARVGLSLGDTLTFDVQGVEVPGRVTSLRKVRWASFQPNFFVLFQPGALEDAPKTFLGTVREIPPEAAERMQDSVAEAFPNVTILNLKETIAKSVDTLAKLEWLVRFLSGFALLIGLAILWLIVDALVTENQRVILLLRALGETRGKLARLFLAHYLGFCAASAMTGYLLSLAAVWVINRVVWQVPWRPDPAIFAACLASAAAVGLLCSVYASYRGAGRPLRELLSVTR